MKPSVLTAALLSSVLLLGGCATSRSVLDIPTPTQKATTASAGSPEVLIGAVNDRRMFEANPASPSIPSLDPSEDQSDSIKARSVGRKRNTFGKALGDILLKEGQSVETLTRDSLRQAFAEKGYKVLNNKEQATSKTLVVDTEIDKFWSWMNPGFAAITLSTEISTNMTIKSPDGSVKETVSVKASDNYQTGMEGNWVEVINKALRLYVEEVKAKLK